MIGDKKPTLDGPPSSDAPPSYDTIGSSGPQSQGSWLETTSLIGEGGPSTPGTSPPTLHQAPPLPLKSPLAPSSMSSIPSSSKGKARATNWLSFSESSESRTTREVRSTILCLVRDLIQEHIPGSSAATAQGILQSCAEACSAHSLSFSSILQEKSIVNRTPLYWVIIKRLPDQHQEVEETSGPDLLSALISHASPLNANTIKDIRLACLETSDQPLFQRLRLSSEFAPVSGSDQMLFGMTILPDDIVVEDLPGGTFAVNFVIPHFHKRMVVSKRITLEFIARSRMWQLSFFVAPDSGSASQPSRSWCISLSLLETSPSIFLESYLVISEAKIPPLPNSPSATSIQTWLKSLDRLKDPAISIRLKGQLEAHRSFFYRESEIVVALNGSLVGQGENLRYGNSPYISADGKLRARFEAKR